MKRNGLPLNTTKKPLIATNPIQHVTNPPLIITNPTDTPGGESSMDTFLRNSRHCSPVVRNERRNIEVISTSWVGGGKAPGLNNYPEALETALVTLGYAIEAPGWKSSSFGI